MGYRLTDPQRIASRSSGNIAVTRDDSVAVAVCLFFGIDSDRRRGILALQFGSARQ
jgi:hypothetical protein